jgi:hypothetical protein
MASPTANAIQPEPSISPPAAEPFLRTLVPALRQLERGLRTWMDSPHRYPLATMTRAALQGEADNLRRQAEALDMERPLLVIMLMGGTGVGKSTLLNALAGGAIAEASFTRPTTRDPVVYYHESVKPERLDPALQHCRLAPHDRPNLEQKILVDTPDLDSNDLSNREKLLRLLPVADVVLYVGSQEKYHDKLGWELFLQQRRRRAFAFVLNKWDRCVLGSASGIRPDEDLVHDLQAEGFQTPLLFRTCAQAWVDREQGNGRPHLPEGEQFPDLVHWLEMGLSRLEIEAIKARGISQLLHHLQRELISARAPDLSEAAVRTRETWERILAHEATSSGEVLLNTLEPYQREIEHHFSLEGQKRFRGLMASYLNLFTRARYVGSSLRGRLRLLPRSGQGSDAPAAWDLYAFTSACTGAAGERHLDARGRALANRLLVAGDGQGFPVELLTEATEKAAKIDWRQRDAHLLVEVLDRIEQQSIKPTGMRRWLQGGLVWLANQLPLIALLGVCILMLWQYTMGEPRREFKFGDFLLPVIVVFIVVVVLHVLITLLLPMRWGAIRGEFQRQLERRLQAELEGAYLPIPGDIAEALTQERHQVEQLSAQTRDVAAWVEQREQAANIAALYGR